MPPRLGRNRIMRTLSAIACLSGVLGPLTSYAMGVTPVTLVLESSGRRASGQINVSNNDPRSLPVEITVARLEINSSGVVSRTPAPDQFVIFPPQAALGPRSSQVFRIQYAGNQPLRQSEAYEISVDQVPVGIKQDAGGAQVEIVYSIGTVVVVAPTGSSARVSIAESNLLVDRIDGAHASVMFQNDGNRHAFLSEGRLSVVARDSDGKVVWQRNLNSEQIRQEIGIGYIPPNGSRLIDLPFHLPEKSKSVAVTFKQSTR